MAKKDDGGPAFAHGGQPHHETRFTAAAQHGMSLRDWFAGMALQGYMASVNEDVLVPDEEQAARTAYQVADAMLEARDR